MDTKNTQLFTERIYEVENMFNSNTIHTMFYLSKEDIEHIFKENFLYEWLEYFYDGEPRFDEEEFSMYMDYLYKHKEIDTSSNTAMYYAFLNLENIPEQKENFRFSPKEYSDEELKRAYESILTQKEEYKDIQLTTNNWIELHSCKNGGWEASQQEVEYYAAEKLDILFKSDVDRWALIENSKEVWLYFYGRDTSLMCDYLFCFKKGNKDGQEYRKEV